MINFIRAFFICIFVPVTFGHVYGQQFKVISTHENYYIASLIGEDDYYAPNYFDDFYIYFNDVKWAHCTRISGKAVDFYFYPLDANQQQKMIEMAKEEALSLPLLHDARMAYQKYLKTRPVYQKEGLYERVAEVIKKLTNTTIDRVIGKSSQVSVINGHLYQYLHSNGVEKPENLTPDDPIVSLLISKFYMLSTTHFFRDWSSIGLFTEYLTTYNKKRSKVPLKMKVYACSSGEEVLSYALELLQYGITDFRIFASDINESSLEFARRMSYSFNSFERLSESKKKLIHQYFTMDATQSIWSPKDMKFFQDRIFYEYQNLLEPLPDSLPYDFAPPYDVISILNVLLYLEDEAVQKNKLYWHSILKERGLLILHDAKYNLYKGWLDPVWNCKHFYNVNEWINIKWTHDLKRKEKQYHRILKKQFQDVAFVSLNFNYQVTDQLLSGYRLTQKSLKKYPTSFTVLSTGAQYLRALGKSNAKVHEAYLGMQKYHGDHLTVLNGLIATESDQKSVLYLTALKDIYLTFLMQYKQDPKKHYHMFNTLDHSLSKYKALPFILKMNALSIMSDHFKRSMAIGDLFKWIESEMLKMEAIFNDIHSEATVIGKTMSETYLNVSEHYQATGDTETSFKTVVKGISLLESLFQDPFYFYYEFNRSLLYVQKAKLLVLKYETASDIDVGQSILESLNTAVLGFRDAEKYIEELPVVKKNYFYGAKGEAYFLRGKYTFLMNAKHKYSRKDFELALQLYETCLESNALYGKHISELRTELFNFVKLYPEFEDLIRN